MSPDRYGDRSLFEPGEDTDVDDPDLTPTDAGPSRIDELRRVLREGAGRPPSPALDVGGAGT